MAINRLDATPEEVVWRESERAHIEHHIKDLKGGLGRERLPSGDVGATAVHVAIGVMPDTLLAQRRLTMPETWATKTIRSIRWCLAEIGGKRITHGRQRLLKLAASVEKSRLYCERRWRTYALSSAEQGCCTRRSGMGGPLEGGVRLRDGSSQLWSG